MIIKKTIAGVAVLATAGIFALTGCSAETAAPAASESSSAIEVDAAAAALVPAEFKDGVSVASDIPYAPMELFDENDNPTGFDYDLSQAIAAKLGIKFSFEDQDWDGIIPSLQSGTHDVIMSGMNDTIERQKVLDFVDYFKAGFAIIVPKGNPESIKALADLCGKTVAIQTSTAQIDLVNAVNPLEPTLEHSEMALQFWRIVVVVFLHFASLRYSFASPISALAPLYHPFTTSLPLFPIALSMRSTASIRADRDFLRLLI